MKKFDVYFVTSAGRASVCRIQAVDKAAVYELSEQYHWQVQQVQEVISFSLWRIAILSPGTLQIMFSQLSALMDSGISVVQAWETVSKDIGNKRQRQRLYQVGQRLRQGISLTQAIKACTIFPSLVEHMVKTGEMTGQLETIFRMLGDHYQTMLKQRQALVQALWYPGFLCICSIGAMFIAIFFLLPMVEDVCVQLEMPLPLMTQRILGIAHFLHAYILWILLGFVGIGVFASVYLRAAHRRQRLLLAVCRVQWIRHWLWIFCWQRCSQLTSLQLHSGITLVEALREAVAAVPIGYFRSHIYWLCHRLEKGESFSKVVEQSPLALDYVRMMLQMGEHTGEYEQALQGIATYYHWQLQLFITRIRRFLGPVALLGMGVFIGGLIVCFVIPILDMTTHVTM